MKRFSLAALTLLLIVFAPRVSVAQSAVNESLDCGELSRRSTSEVGDHVFFQRRFNRRRLITQILADFP